MGISSNQARFLAISARQVDLEFRMQQICQRRLRLSSELEEVATTYNNKISNRQMYTMTSSNGGINSSFSIASINAMRDTNGNAYSVIGLDQTSAYNAISDANVNAATGITIGTQNYSLAMLGLTGQTGITNATVIDAALRAGYLQIATVPDQYTQVSTPVTGIGTGLEIKDWRTIPQLADELYGADDTNVENWYDNIVTQINSQDKKLQLEQSSVEVEYKAVTSEKEAVKKILDTNAQSSFKYFS